MSSLTAFVLLGNPVDFQQYIIGRTMHVMEEGSALSAPEVNAKAREESMVAVFDAIVDGCMFPAAIIETTDLCHVTVRACLKSLVAENRVEKYSPPGSKRFFYRVKEQ